jgi:hypothetical protein
MSDEPFDLDPEQEERLDALIAEYLTAVQSGKHPDRQKLLGKHPDLAEPLAVFFADQEHFNKLVRPLRRELPESPARSTPGPDASTLGFSSASPGTVPAALQCFGDYQLEEEIARGGMGVVYRAIQGSLNRPVALKMILAGSLASVADVERFHHEAEAAALLDHANIVPVYEVGERDGFHYFSMKLIEGGDLTRHVSRFSGDPCAAAKTVAAIADGVHHAHQRGILHRDLVRVHGRSSALWEVSVD